jgi:hypothetical protein
MGVYGGSARMVGRGMLLVALTQANVLTSTSRISACYYENLMARPKLIQFLMDYTKELRYNADIKTRIHCLLKGIDHQPYCSCGKALKMRMTGREAYTFPTHCSNKCTSNDEKVIQQRKDTNIKKYGVITPLLKSNISAVSPLFIDDTKII